MRSILAIAASIVADALRRKVVYVVFVFAAIMVLVIPRLPSYGVGVVGAVYREVAMALMYFGAMVVALSLSAVRVPVEIERRTVYNILVKDVRRWQYLAGTWLGISVVLAGVIASFNVINQVVGLAFYGDAMWRLWQGAFAIWLEMSVLVAFAVAVSAFIGPVVVVVTSLAFLFVLHTAPSPGNVPGSIKTIAPSLDIFNVINPVAHGSGYGPLYAISMVVAFIGWVGLWLGIGSALFSRRDL